MSEPARHLRLVDEDGQIVSDGCPECAAREDEVAGLKDTVAKLGAQIRKMKRDEDAERKIHPHRALIEDIHRFWQSATGRKGKLGAKRFDTVAALLRVELDEDVPESPDWKIRLAIIGAATAANHSDAGEPFDDLELICREETKVDSFARRAYLWGEKARKP